MNRQSPLPEGLRGRGFGPAAARAVGVGENRLRRKDLFRPFHGVRVDAPPTNVFERCTAYAPRLKPGQFFSHSTAAALLGLPLPQHLEAETWVHVSALLPADAPHARNVRGHRILDALAPQILAGLPVAHELDAFVQLGRELDVEDLVVVADQLLNRTGLPEDDAKRVMLERVRAVRRAGAGRLVRAIGLARRGSRSAAETRVRLVLMAAGLPEAELNAPINERESGRYLGAPDLVWRQQRVVLEYEGDGHRVSRDQFRYDIGRYDDLMADGWRVIRATGDDLTAAGRQRLVERVRRAIADR